MSFLTGGSQKQQAQQQPAYTGLQIQTSAYGKAIPLVYGTQRVAPNLLWYGDFKAIKHTSSASGGGKGGGGGATSTTYTYRTSVQMALAQGPIQAVGNVYVDKNVDTMSSLGFSLFTGTALQSAWGYLTTNHPGEALTYRNVAHTDVSNYNLGSSADLSNHNFEVRGIFSNTVSGKVDADASQVVSDILTNGIYGAGFPSARLGQLNQADEPHTIPGTPYHVTVTNSAGFYQNLAVQDSGGNLFTCVSSSPAQGQYSFSSGVYIFNSADSGTSVTISYGWTQSLVNYQDYTLAANLLLSVAYSDQSQTSSMLDDLMQATNSAPVWSSGVLNFVPYGDESLTGNGATYTPPGSALFDLTDDDFMPNTNASGGASSSSNTDPVIMTRTRAADQYNSIQLEYLDRSNAYNTAIVEAKDQAAIDQYGLRQDTSRNAHMFADGTIALQSAWLQLQRESIRNTYQFTLDQRYIVLDCMDIVTLTDSGLGLNKQWVRITQITENDDYTLTFTAEEYLAGTGNAASYSFETGQGYSPDYNTPAGDVNAPVLFEAPVQIATTSGLEVWVAASGGSLWGGADVWISSDGENYKFAGRIEGVARQGVLSASLASGSDPDTVNTLSVDLTESNGSLLSGTQEDADLGHTLCYVDGELISYETATMTGANAYDLTYLRRGMYGTTISSHASGTQFARLDNAIFVYSYDKSQIGQTIYVKLLSFNIYGGAEENLSDVNAYTHLIVGPPRPADVMNFTGQQNGGALVFKWDEVLDYALKGYDILYGPVGSDLTSATFLTESERGTEMTNASVPPGTWTFYMRARDIADQFSANPATFNLTVTNQNAVIGESDQNPDWSGTLVNFYPHWTGIIIPVGTKTCDQYTVLSAPSAPSLAAVAGGTITATTYYVTTTYVTVSGETLVSSESSLLVAVNNLLSVASPAPSGEATSWNVYVSTSSGTETLQNAVPLQIGAGWTEPITGLVAGASPPSMNTTGWEVFNVFVPDPVSEASYTTATIDTGFNSQFRVWGATSAQMGPGETGIPDVSFALDSWLSGGTDPGVYTNWSIGFITAEYVKGRITATITPGEVPYVSTFSVTTDIEPTSVQVTGFAVGSMGTMLNYADYGEAFHSLPNVQVTPTSAGATSGTASAESTTSCTITLYNGTTPVSGTANITITGV